MSIKSVARTGYITPRPKQAHKEPYEPRDILPFHPLGSSDDKAKDSTEAKSESAKPKEEKNEQTTTGSNPPGGSGTSTGGDLQNTTNSSVKSIKATLGFLGTTIACGLISLAAHFTNFFGEGSARDTVALVADGGAALSGVLTLGEVLKPIGNDDAGVHQNVITNAN